MSSADAGVLFSYAVTGLILVGCALLPAPPVPVRLVWAVAGTGLVAWAAWPLVSRGQLAGGAHLPLLVLPALTIGYAAHVLRGYTQRREPSEVYVVTPPALEPAVPADPWDALYASVAVRQELPSGRAEERYRGRRRAAG